MARLGEAPPPSPPGALLEYFDALTRAQPTAPVPWLGLFLAAGRAGDEARALAAHATLAGLHAELASLALRATPGPPGTVAGRTDAVAGLDGAVRVVQHHIANQREEPVMEATITRMNTQRPG